MALPTLGALQAEAGTLGTPGWRPMLAYVARLHAASVHAPTPPFPEPWEEIGPGYCYGPAFGHWDIVHQILDVLPAEPEHARRQLRNNLAAQEPDGLVPGVIWMRHLRTPPAGDGPAWSRAVGHPPVWPVAAQDWADHTGDDGPLREGYAPLLRQLGWFE